jgi:hypothetical protein
LTLAIVSVESGFHTMKAASSLRSLLTLGIVFSALFSRAQVDGNLSKGLIAHFTLDADARDASGNNNDGTPHNTQPTEDRFGRIAKAIRFNGKTSFIECRIPKIPTGATPRTVSLWAKPELDVKGVALVSWGSVPRLFNIFNIGSPYVWGVGTHGGGNGIENVAVNNDWHHVVTTYDGGTLSLFVDGKSAGKRAMKIDTAFSALFLGKPASQTASHFSGAIDDVRIYNRALSEGEVRQLLEFEQRSQLQVATSANTNTNAEKPPRARIVRQFPTNAHTVTLSIGSGEVVAFDTNSFVLRVEDTNGAKFLPRTTYAKLSDADVKALLMHPKIYTNATHSNGGVVWSGRPTDSPFKVADAARLENRLREIWEGGGTLGNRVAERLEILEALKNYNGGLAFWLANEAQSETAATAHETALLRQANAVDKIEEAQYLRNLGIRRRYSDAIQERNGAANERERAKQEYAYRRQQAPRWKAQFLSALNFLNQKGFQLPSESEFVLLPPLISEAEIEAALTDN